MIPHIMWFSNTLSTLSIDIYHHAEVQEYCCMMAGWGAKFCFISSALYKHNVLDKFWRYQFDSAEKFSESRKNDDEKVFFYSLAFGSLGGRISKMADLEIEF